MFKYSKSILYELKTDLNELKSAQMSPNKPKLAEMLIVFSTVMHINVRQGICYNFKAV